MQIKMEDDRNVKFEFHEDQVKFWDCGCDDHPFTFIDGGEVLAEDIQNAKYELHRKIMSVAEKIDLVWEVVRTLIVYVVPVLSCLGLAFICQFCLPTWMSMILTTLFLIIAIGLTFLSLGPLTNAIETFQDFRLYRPKLLKCKCKACKNKNNCCEQETNSGNVQPKGLEACEKEDSNHVEVEMIKDTSTQTSDGNKVEIGLKRRQLKTYPPIEQNDNVFRESASYLESSFHGEVKDSNGPNVLEID